jgi:hypothetical protein
VPLRLVCDLVILHFDSPRERQQKLDARISFDPTNIERQTPLSAGFIGCFVARECDRSHGISSGFKCSSGIPRTRLMHNIPTVIKSHDKPLHGDNAVLSPFCAPDGKSITENPRPTLNAKPDPLAGQAYTTSNNRLPT